jgi:hypothetical protein
MKTLSALLIIVLFLICGCSKKTNPEATRSTVGQPQKAHHEGQEDLATTPDDPEAKVISPLSILKEQAMPTLIKPEPEQQYVRREPLPIDHSTNLPPQDSIKLLHKVFSVSKYVQFGFVVPPHQGNTRLRGTFRSFTKRNDLDTSDRTADVDLLLLNDEEFKEFLHGQPQSVTYELNSAHNQMVKWHVPATYGDPQTYHLVFSNSGNGPKIKFVEADFTVNFE